jgi:hypothetical protein
VKSLYTEEFEPVIKFLKSRALQQTSWWISHYIDENQVFMNKLMQELRNMPDFKQSDTNWLRKLKLIL